MMQLKMCTMFLAFTLEIYFSIYTTFQLLLKLVFTKVTWLSHDSVSWRIIPRKFNDSTLSIFIPLIEIFKFWICFCFLWKIINFVFCTFNDNLLFIIIYSDYDMRSVLHTFFCCLKSSLNVRCRGWFVCSKSYMNMYFGSLNQKKLFEHEIKISYFSKISKILIQDYFKYALQSFHMISPFNWLVQICPFDYICSQSVYYWTIERYAFIYIYIFTANKKTFLNVNVPSMHAWL